ncbi:Ig-like domain-containing protein, partial [Arenimonas sp.]|uniref:Ig-like domain-containing protein n=1 Tax=Arenimonas sp. TaxID=1872635 RepID=UPI002D7E2BF8
MVFTITATNNGPAPAVGVVVNDLLPDGYALVVATPSVGSYDGLSGVWTVGTLANAGSATLVVEATVLATGNYQNTATVTATTPDPTPGNNSDSETPTPGPVADLSVAKLLLSSSPVAAGGPVQYQVTIANAGPSPVLGATFADTVPSGLVGATWTCAPAANCSSSAGAGDVGLLLDIPAGQSVVVVMSGTAPVATPATIGANTATISVPAGISDPDAGNDTDTVPPITVDPLAIVAVADTGSVASGATGGVAVPNVLANDTLDGAPATLANVTLTQVSTTNPNVTLNPATGEVSVAAGTPAGSYTVVYEICELLNPANCDTAAVTVTVANAPPVAQDDAATVVESSVGNVINVLANDSDPEDGAPVVTVSSGTTANGGSFSCSATQCTYTPVAGYIGNDSFSYEACDTNGLCDTATVAITVVPRTLSIVTAPVCVADAAYLDYSIAGGNFDATGLDATIEWLDGLGNVVQTLNAQPLSGQLLWPGMVVNAGVASDWPGWVLSGGLWVQAPDGFEGLRPSATVRISVNPTEVVIVNYPPATPLCEAAPPVNQSPIAVDDSDATVGVAPVTTTVLANDSDPEAGPLAVSIAVAPANGLVVVNGDGTVTYTPNAGFQGVDTYQYTITDAAGLTDTATVTITVTWLPVDAVDDSGSVPNGAVGGLAVPDVLFNDTLDGAPATLATVTLAQVSTTDPNVTLDTATGEVNVAAGTPAGTYTVVYQACELLNPANCDTATVTVTVGAAVIDAVADTGTVANGASGGVAVADVLVNDTLNGSPATLATVSLTQVSTTNPNVTPNPATGSVDVAPGTPAGTYTVVYQICEVLNPTNCDTASVAVTVGAAVIDAVADTGTVANGVAGGVAVPNVLVNDTLNGAAATLADVSLTQVSTSNPNVTLNPATGAVDVAPGTPAGTYSVVYQLCEILNPTNCDTATVTVTVGAAIIDAVDDTGSVANGAAGGAAVPNVLVNDTLNGAPVTLATVSLTQVSTTNPNVTLNPATGSVDVAAGTSAGTYTLIYEICEILNPSNCDTATVTVTVGAAVIDAVDDTGTVANGAAGGVAIPNVLVNDTLNGAAATLADVSLTQVSTSNPNVTLNPATGEVNVALGTPAGTYTVVYQICEILNPTNCDTATVTVTVGAAVIDAVDDSGSVASGATGGSAVPNVLANDTLNGSPATLATVTLTQVSTTNPNVTLNPATGGVDVAAGTPAGTYTVVYQLCELLNPTNCDNATVTVTVGAAVIDAVDDTGTVANGAAGGVAVADVLVNDTLNGSPATLATVALTQVSTTNPNVTLNPATGEVNVAPGTSAGTYTFVYQICELLNPTNCDTATVTVTVDAAVVDAIDDTGTVANGAAGGVAVPNVLVNDTLDGAPATLATVALTQVSTTNPNVTLNPATGGVDVAAGTPAGTYTIVYQLCELLNPTNCDNATVTVTVGAAVIDAFDDTGTVANGAAGGVAVADVLVNDTLNGSPATLATVALTQVSTTNPNVTLNPATGSVDVAAGTPAGTYTVVYQICELLNPTNCDTATVTVTVGAAVVDAVDDTGSVASGATGGVAVPDVLVNDTLNGAPATLATVTLTQISTTNPNVTLNPATGEVNVAPGTPAGTYTVVYQLCEILNPTNCDTASVTVTVGAAIIDAVDDVGTVANGAAGGVAVADVLVNDTLNGAAATLADVSLTQVS